ncbi:sugar ABC transporter ATP-binding protein [Vibrio sp. S17_S38]|uniref:sugar ABC transporter ATP-binding protein n=1 Tax=Vibrio sp. S17_S38 TaxID=2720229 RepID=UPI00167FFCF3|nr:sugar ABC transporter ATP-binding protein [Vibrio sp. S17_S38]MBD1572122.1 sugar ABC transporter ATP-binding protein [Vibrio sp. S17_S38]
MNDTPLIRTEGITKVFPGVKSLSNVDFELRRGEIHALLGGNGAGKSTLIKCITGVYQPEQGSIYLNNQSITGLSPDAVQASGISTVHQEVNLIPNISVAENIYLCQQPKKWGRIDWVKMNTLAKHDLQQMGITIDVKKNLSEYSVAIQQMVAIARGVSMSAKVLILDEPTASLDPSEVKQLFRVMRHLAQQGIGIIFVTHFLEQVYEITDRISVLRNGAMVGTFETARLPQVELINHMLGKALSQSTRVRHNGQDHENIENFMQAYHVSKSNSINKFDLNINHGEIVGLGGLLGSGRTEIARVLFGVDKKDSGIIQVHGKNCQIKTPRDAIAHGIALCPEDRKKESLIGDLSVKENIMLALQAKNGWLRTIPAKEQQSIAIQFIKSLNIVISDLNRPVKDLSGGNQQKVVLARWLASKPDCLILDEPTRGVDVGARKEIERIIHGLCQEGLALLLIASELEEIAELSDRVLVLKDRQVVNELRGDQISVDSIMNSIAGVSV